MAGLSSSEFAEFNGLLASVIERGLGLESAVGLLSDQAGSRRVRDALERVKRALGEGASLPQALEAAPRLFPEEYRALVRAGVSLVELRDDRGNTSARSPVRPQSL